MAATKTLELDDLALANEEVRAFCARKGIVDELKRLMKLTRERFQVVGNLTFELSADEETGEERVVLNVVAQGELGELSKTYFELMKEWVGVSSPADRESILFSYQSD